MNGEGYVRSELRQQRKRQVAKYMPKGIAPPQDRRDLSDVPTDGNAEMDEITESNLMAYAILGSMTT
jgi:hypothetical protein